MDQSKLFIKEIPENIKQILQQIHLCLLQKKDYNHQSQQVVIDWLNEKYGDYLLYDYWDEVTIVIHNKDRFVTLMLETIEDKFNKAINEIPKSEICNIFREHIRLSIEVRDDDASGVTSVCFEFDDCSLVFAYLISQIHPQAEPNLYWIGFFLNDADVIAFINQNDDWINCRNKFDDQEILSWIS